MTQEGWNGDHYYVASPFAEDNGQPTITLSIPLQQRVKFTLGQTSFNVDEDGAREIANALGDLAPDELQPWRVAK